MDNARVARWRRCSAWLAAGVGVLLLLVFISLGMHTRTDHFPRWVREQWEKRY